MEWRSYPSARFIDTHFHVTQPQERTKLGEDFLPRPVFMLLARSTSILNNEGSQGQQGSFTFLHEHARPLT